MLEGQWPVASACFGLLLAAASCRAHPRRPPPSHSGPAAPHRLLQRTAPSGRPGLWYVAEEGRRGKLSPKMDHLVCFLPGVWWSAGGQRPLGSPTVQHTPAALLHCRSTRVCASRQRLPLAGLLALGDLHGVSTQRSPEEAAATPPADGTSSSSSDGGAAAAAAAVGEGERAPQQRRPPRRPAYVPGGADSWQASGEDMPDLQLAAELALTCYELYRRTPAGLAPEIAHFANNTGAGGVLFLGVRVRVCVCRVLRVCSSAAALACTPPDPGCPRSCLRRAPAELPLDFPNKHVHDVGRGDFTIKPKVGAGVWPASRTTSCAVA